MGSVLSIINNYVVIPMLFEKALGTVIDQEPEVKNEGNDGIDILQLAENYVWEAIKYPFPNSWKD